jgi:uncharacterized protein
MTMTSKMDPVIHFEVPAEDSDRVRTFYESAFGWQTTPLGSEMGDFVLAFTTETDQKTRIPRKRGAINGGFYRRMEINQSVKLTILVDDIREAVKKSKRLAAKFSASPSRCPASASLQASGILRAM